MLGYIDESLVPKKIKLYIAKPNKQIIGNLNHIHNLEYTPVLGRLSEVSFTIPYDIYDEINQKNIRNKMVDRLLERFLIKGVVDDKEEWFIINEINDSMGDKKDEKSVHAYSLGYELRDKTVRGYKAASLNLYQVSEDVLATSIWKIGEIEHEFYVKYRSFDVSEQSLLDFIYEIADTYQALIEFDTVNRVIHFRSVEKVGENKGLTISYGKYLKRLGKKSEPDEMVTRLHVFGKDGLSINRINPTGSPYLEDFNYFMYPFERDENRNIIKVSRYMTDGLCHALLDYRELIKSKKGVFDNLLTQKENLQVEKTTKDNEMSVLQTELTIILDQLDLAKGMNEDTTQLNTNKVNKELEINSKQTEINNIIQQIETVDLEIKNLQNEISIENNFTPEQIAERDQYIIERTWSDSNYINDKELYIDAQERFKEIKQPKTTFTLEIVDFLQILEEQKNWDKLVIGDEINIKYEYIGVNIRAKITEIKFNYDSRSISISIANVKDLHGDAKNLLKLLKQSASTSKTLELNKYKYDEYVERTDKISDIIEGKWDAAKRRIVAGVNESVDISGRGIIIRNPDFPNQIIVMQSGVLALSEDFGNTWKTAITPTHIVAERLLGKLIMGENMIIGDNDGTFEIKGNLMTIKDRQNIVRLLMGEYANNKFGLKLLNKAGNAVVLDEDGILQTWQEGRTDNVDSSNGLSLYVFLPSNTLSVRQAILNFKLLPFRSYSRGTESGGGTTATSSNGGGTTATSSSGGGTTATSSSGGGTSTSTQNGGGTNTSTDSGGGNVVTSSTKTFSQLNTTTGVPTGAIGDENYGYHVHNVSLSGGFWEHNHSISIPSHSHDFSVPSHSHNFSVPSHTHDVTISNHNHTVEISPHQHTVTIPSHVHDIEHGIYTGTTATGIGIIINGINRTSTLGGKFNTDKNDLNITQYMNIGQWNEIRLTSDTLGRIDGNIFIQTFMGV